MRYDNCLISNKAALATGKVAKVATYYYKQLDRFSTSKMQDCVQTYPPTPMCGALFHICTNCAMVSLSIKL